MKLCVSSVHGRTTRRGSKNDALVKSSITQLSFCVISSRPLLFRGESTALEREGDSTHRWTMLRLHRAATSIGACQIQFIRLFWAHFPPFQGIDPGAVRHEWIRYGYRDSGAWHLCACPGQPPVHFFGANPGGLSKSIQSICSSPCLQGARSLAALTSPTFPVLRASARSFAIAMSRSSRVSHALVPRPFLFALAL